MIDQHYLNSLLNPNLFSGIIGAIIGVFVGHYLTKRRQRNVWTKEFDKISIERVLSVFEEILIVVNKKGEFVNEELIDKLSARVAMMDFHNDSLDKKIDELKRACFAHRDGVRIKTPASTTGKISQEEEQAAKDVKRVISELRSEIRSLYSK
jgi:hypothetical protein